MQQKCRIDPAFRVFTYVVSTPCTCRVPRATSIDDAVLLNVATHSDGTITYSFGCSSELPPPPVVTTAPTIPLDTQHEVTTHASNNNNGTSAAVKTPAAIEQLDKLLHLTPQVSTSTRSPRPKETPQNGATTTTSNNKNGSSTVDTAAHKRALGKVAAGPSASSSSSSSSNSTSSSSQSTLQSVSYTDTPANTIERLYSRLCDSGRLDDALTVLKDSIRAGRVDVLKQLKHYKFLRPAKRQRAVRAALRFVQLLPRQYADPRTYNMVLSVCAGAGDVRAALRVADMLRAAGHRMDTILYTTIIKTCAVAGDAEHAFQLYSEMKATGVKAEKQVFATLISACSEQIVRTPAADRRTQLVLLERAFALVQNMQDIRLNPDAPVWNALVTAAGRAGQLQRAFDVLEDMLGAGTRPNARTYGSLIDACARTGDKELALRVYAKARREGFTGELIVYSAAINACMKAKTGADLDRAMEIYADMQRADVAPDSALFGALMMAAGRSGDLPLALDLHAEMLREGLKPCTGTESALIAVHVHQEKLPEAQAIYRRMRSAGVAPHIHAVNALINAYGRAMRLGDVVSLVCDMIDAGLTPDAFTFSGVLNACQRSDECELGVDVYRAMRMRGVKLDGNIAETLLRMSYNRMRQRWRPGGYPPQRMQEDGHRGGGGGGRGKTGAVGALNSSAIGSSSRREGHRAQEASKLLAALTPPGKKVVPCESGEVPWQSHAFHIYRESLSSGVKPSLKLMNMMFACLRVPWGGAGGVDGDPSIDLATQTQRLLAGFPATSENATLVQGKIGVEGIYHVRAISMLEEAIVSGLLPSFKIDIPSPIDLRKLPPNVAEVYVLTVISALQRQIEARRELKHRIVFLVPRYDGHRVFMPSFLTDSDAESDSEGVTVAVPSGISSAASVFTEGTFEGGSENDNDMFSQALKENEECTGDEKTGLGVAGVLRRLRLWSREYSPEGLIVVEVREVTKWAKMIQRDIDRRSASALALQKPYGQSTSGVGGGGVGGPAGSLWQQSSSIRSRGF